MEAGEENVGTVYHWCGAVNETRKEGLIKQGSPECKGHILRVGGFLEAGHTGRALFWGHDVYVG